MFFVFWGRASQPAIQRGEERGCKGSQPYHPWLGAAPMETLGAIDDTSCGPCLCHQIVWYCTKYANHIHPL